MACSRGFRSAGVAVDLAAWSWVAFGSPPDLSSFARNVGSWGISRPQFRASGGPFVAISGLKGMDVHWFPAHWKRRIMTMSSGGGLHLPYPHQKNIGGGSRRYPLQSGLRESLGFGSS